MLLMQCHKVTFFRPSHDWKNLLDSIQIQMIQLQIPGQKWFPALYRLLAFYHLYIIVQAAE